jgi:hypothetical protein
MHTAAIIWATLLVAVVVLGAVLVLVAMYAGGEAQVRPGVDPPGRPGPPPVPLPPVEPRSSSTGACHSSMSRHQGAMCKTTGYISSL